MSVATLEAPASTVRWVTSGKDVGAAIRARRMALGLTAKALAAEAGVDRSRVTAVEDGDAVRSSTLGAIDAALARLEEAMSGPYDAATGHITQTIELPDGTKVTIAGPMDNVVEAAERFLRRNTEQQ